MPFLSEQALNQVQAFIQKKDVIIEKLKDKMHLTGRERQIGQVKFALEAILTAAALGYGRGYVEKTPGQAFNVPYTSLDAEFAVGMAALGGALLGGKWVGKYDEDILAVSIGALSHYCGQLGRNMGKTGQFSLVAGDEPSLIAAAHHSGMFAPHHHPGALPAALRHISGDPLAEALASVV
jgi:hypothetical protein